MKYLQAVELEGEESECELKTINKYRCLIIIDLTPPVIANYEVSSVISTGGTVVNNYWNSTNTGLDVSLKVLALDESVTNGSLRILSNLTRVLCVAGIHSDKELTRFCKSYDSRSMY